VSNWTLLAVASLLLVYPTGLSILYSGSIAVRYGLVYATESAGRFVNSPGWHGLCYGPYLPETEYEGVDFQGHFEQGGSGCGNISLSGVITESGGGNYSFSISCGSGSWITPDLLAGLGCGPALSPGGGPWSFILMVSVTLIPGAPLLAGPTLFIVGAIGLVAYAAVLIVRFRRRRARP
jgi:hypothetical protein